MAKAGIHEEGILPLTDRVEPKLFLIARSGIDHQEVQRFLDSENLNWNRTETATQSESLVELAGRLCYLSFGARQSPKTNYEYIKHLIGQGHESVLEHVSWTFILTGVSRAFTHQLVRHRVGFSYSQLSQQYHDESEAALVRPSIIEKNPDLIEIWHKSVEQSQEAYQEILTRLGSRFEQSRVESKREYLREIRSAARSVMPEGTETKIAFTANARAIRHFLDIRGAIIGDEEMRLVGALLLEMVRKDAPALFEDFRVDELPDGSPIVRHLTSSST
jgi:thymidylate synthase (FAD)